MAGVVGKSWKSSVLDRFMAGFIPEPNSGCWLWDAAYLISSSGPRGRITANGKRRYAARVAYELFVGPIEDGKIVCHKCDVPLCVNPSHLYMGTSADNSQDMFKRGRSTFGTKHGRVKLTEAQVIAILNDPRPQHEIANSYGVTPSAIYLIKQGRTWQYLTRSERHANL